MGRIKNMLVVTGGSIDVPWARGWLERVNAKMPFDYCMAVDSGLNAVDALGLKVDYILGDYDSVSSEVLARYRHTVETVAFPREKDYTDTELSIKAVLELMKGGGGRVTYLGATGTRLDHTLANLGLLLQLDGTGVEGCLVDRHNRIRLLCGGGHLELKQNEQFGRFISFLPLGDGVQGLTVSGVRYPLENRDIPIGVSLCVSNEITGEVMKASLGAGRLLVFETRD